MHEIPEMTHELGRHWDQPLRHNIRIDGDYAIMTEKTSLLLHRYDTSLPSGVYEGKMWARLEHDDELWLCWYGPSNEPDKCSINCKKIRVEYIPLSFETPMALPQLPESLNL